MTHLKNNLTTLIDFMSEKFLITCIKNALLNSCCFWLQILGFVKILIGSPGRETNLLKLCIARKKVNVITM